MLDALPWTRVSPQEEEVPHRPPKGQGTTSLCFVVSLSLSSFFGSLDCMLAFLKASAMFLLLSLSSCASALSCTRCDAFVLLRSGVVSAWWYDER